jgi:NhaA family Na+:H+ antiporter
MKRVFDFVADHFIAVPIGAVIALAWANSHAESYFEFAHALSFAVNDIGMTLVFAFLAQEVLEATMPGGELYTWRRSTLPLVAALGGTVGAIGAYEGYVHAGDESLLSVGWPILCGIDLGLSSFLVRILLRDQQLVAFVLLTVIVSDAIGLIAVGLHPQSAWLHVAGALLIVAGVGVSAALSRLKIVTFWPHVLVSGTIVWFGFWWGGLHPALALVPIVPFLPRAPRDIHLFVDSPHGPHDSPAHLEHALRVPVHVVAFLFALVNAGTLVRGFGTGTWAVLAGALVGRPLGILGAVGLSVALGLRLPARVGWRELIVVAFAVSASVTFGLFFATGVFPIGPALMQVKIGALLTVGGSLIAAMAAWLLGAGRFDVRRLTRPEPRGVAARSRR